MSITGGSRQRKKRDSDWGTTTDTTQFKRAVDMTDNELAAIVAKARLTVMK